MYKTTLEKIEELANEFCMLRLKQIDVFMSQPEMLDVHDAVEKLRRKLLDISCEMNSDASCGELMKCIFDFDFRVGDEQRFLVEHPAKDKWTFDENSRYMELATKTIKADRAISEAIDKVKTAIENKNNPIH